MASGMPGGVPEEIFSLCRKRNRTVERMFLSADKTVADLLFEGRNRLEKNRKVPPFAGSELFREVCREYVAERFGEEAGEEAAKSLRAGALLTADHLGGLYSVQSLQGDLLFGQLHETVSQSRAVPVFAFGCVSASSSTFARGMLIYSQPDRVLKIPVLPRRPTNGAASLIRGYDRSMAEQAIRAAKEIGDGKVREAALHLLNTVYLREDILSCGRFAEQAVRLAEAIYSELPAVSQNPAGKKRYVFLEAEEVFSRLLLRELKEPGSAAARLLWDAAFLRALDQTVCQDGKTLSSRLFWGCDRNSRVFPMTFCGDGSLRGTDTEGNAVSFSAAPDMLAELLKKRQVLPGLYLCWLLSAALRDFTWYGGIFQSRYLPEYAALTAEALRDCAGMERHARRAESLSGEDLMTLAAQTAARDHGGYISGPLYALWDVKDGAVPAGAAELFAYGKALPDIGAVPLPAAHELGCFEFYNDLTDAGERTDRWYERIADYAKKTYGEIILPR